MDVFGQDQVEAWTLHLHHQTIVGRKHPSHTLVTPVSFSTRAAHLHTDYHIDVDVDILAPTTARLHRLHPSASSATWHTNPRTGAGNPPLRQPNNPHPPSNAPAPAPPRPHNPARCRPSATPRRLTPSHTPAAGITPPLHIRQATRIRGLARLELGRGRGRRRRGD